jgi:hypothetical protein
MCEKTMGRRVLPTWVALMLLVGVLAFPQAARAASIEAKGRAAKIACLSGDYAKGVALLAEMFVSTGNTIHLFNQGRCFEQNGKYEEAIVRFREFLRKHPEKDVPGLAAEKHIVDCEALIDKQKGKASPPPTTTPRPPVDVKPVVEPAPAPAPVVQVAAPPPAPVIVAPAPAPTTVSAAPEKARPDDSPPPPPTLQVAPTLEYPWQHTAKWVATGAAVALLGFGAYEHWRYYSKNRDYNRDPKCYDLGQCKGLADAADKAQTLTIIGYGFAAVATGLAVWFWLTDSPSQSPAQTAAIRLTCTPTLTGAACGGRF